MKKAEAAAVAGAMVVGRHREPLTLSLERGQGGPLYDSRLQHP